MARPDIVLASASPRRRELLAAVGIRVRVHPVTTDEAPLRDEAPADYVARLAVEKSALAAASVSGRPAAIIAADTAVVARGEIFGKPESESGFRRMIEALSGGTHEVHTGVAVRSAAGCAVRVVVSRVTMRPIAAAEAAAYWASGEPRDKAGGYAIQGLGSLFISALNGSYSAVVGLPLFETAELLADAGIDVLALAAARETRGR